MNESKELLEATVKGLQEKVRSLQIDLDEKQQELENINKTKITGELYDEIGNTIDDAIESFNFGDTENYDFDYGIESDGKVYVESIGIGNTYELINSIMKRIDDTFNILPRHTEENSAQ